MKVIAACQVLGFICGKIEILGIFFDIFKVQDMPIFFVEAMVDIIGCKRIT